MSPQAVKGDRLGRAVVLQTCLERASLSAGKNRILSWIRNRIPLSMPRAGDRSSSHMLSGSPSSESGLAGIQIQPGLYHIAQSYRTQNHLRWWKTLKRSELPQFIWTAHLFSPLNRGDQEKLFSFYKTQLLCMRNRGLQSLQTHHTPKQAKDQAACCRPARGQRHYSRYECH